MQIKPIPCTPLRPNSKAEPSFKNNLFKKNYIPTDEKEAGKLTNKDPKEGNNANPGFKIVEPVKEARLNCLV